jgi:hypothetical protein
MKPLTQLMTQVFVPTLLGVSITATLGSGTPLLAQSAATLADPNANDDLNNLWSGRDGDSAASMYSLINKLQSLSGRSAGEFAEEQDENFNAALDEFRKKQQEQLQTSPAQPAIPGAVDPAAP